MPIKLTAKSQYFQIWCIQLVIWNKSSAYRNLFFIALSANFLSAFFLRRIILPFSICCIVFFFYFVSQAESDLWWLCLLVARVTLINLQYYCIFSSAQKVECIEIQRKKTAIKLNRESCDEIKCNFNVVYRFCQFKKFICENINKKCAIEMNEKKRERRQPQEPMPNFEFLS